MFLQKECCVCTAVTQQVLVVRTVKDGSNVFVQ